MHLLLQKQTHKNAKYVTYQKRNLQKLKLISYIFNFTKIELNTIKIENKKQRLQFYCLFISA